MSADTVICAGVTTSRFSLGADTGAHGTTETEMFSAILPSGALDTSGVNSSVRMMGIASATVVPPSLTLRLKYGSTTICSLPAAPPSNATNHGWVYGAETTTLSSNQVFGQAWFLYPSTPQGGHSGNTAAITVTTGGTVTVSITGQWGATTAGNTFTMTNAIVDIGGLTP